MYLAGATAAGASAVARGVAYFNLGHLLGTEKKYREAEDAYRIAMGLNPGYPSAYSNMGKLFADQERFEDALRLFEQAALLEPNSCTAHTNVASALRSMGVEHARAARAPLEAAVAADPACQKAQAGLGVVLSQTQEWGLSIPPLEAPALPRRTLGARQASRPRQARRGGRRGRGGGAAGELALPRQNPKGS